MVKVIGLDPNFVKQTTCRKCGHILQYEPSDVRERQAYDYTGDYDIYKVITCPQCSNEVIVK